MKEPTNNLDEIVPGRLTSAELRAMALRQQQQIDSQHQLLATKEQRLRFLKSQEVRNAVANAEGERLRRLRERVEAQESKLRRLRALRGQVDLQKTYNVTLSNDLDSIRALFSEKEKELSLAVAKVEALTRQLEDLRRDRRCPINLIATNGGSGTAQPLPPQASRELEKLRRELMYRNQLSLQQDARLHMQREALQQRQAELRSVDQRIYELQTRLQRKKAANIQIVAQNQNHHQQLHVQPHLIQQQQQQQQQQPPPPPPQQQHQQQHQLQQHQQQQQQTHAFSSDPAFQASIAKQGVAALKQQLLQKQTNQLAASQQHTTKFSNIINRETNRNIPRGNVAAVEPYIHTPQKSTITPTASYSLGAGNILKHAAATANTNQQNQLIQDLTHVKLNLAHHSNPHVPSNAANANFFSGESDESKLLAKKMLSAAAATSSIASKATATATAGATEVPSKTKEVDTSHHIYAEVGPKKRDLMKEATSHSESTHPTVTAATTASSVPTMQTGSSKIPKSITSSASASALINKLNNAAAAAAAAATSSAPTTTGQISPSGPSGEKTEQSKKSGGSPAVASEMLSERNTQQQLTVHSMPLGTANKSVATPVSNNIACTTTTAASTSNVESILAKHKPLATGSLAVPPRKPISSVAPTSVTSSIPKMITYSPKVNRVAPNVVNNLGTAATTASAISGTAAISTSTSTSALAVEPPRPALPPKPSKMSPTESGMSSSAETAITTSSTTASSSISVRKSLATAVEVQTTLGLQTLSINDNLPIKAKPLTIRKQPMSEQPRLKNSSIGSKSSMQMSRKVELPSSAIFFNDPTRAALKDRDASGGDQTANRSSPDQPFPAATAAGHAQSSPTGTSQSSSSVDEPDRMDANSNTMTIDEKMLENAKRRSNSNSHSAISTTTTMTTATSISTTITTTTTATTSTNGKPKLARRVSFDPLALLLDASLEGELELVKKTAMQVANPSAANDEGITALHNAICAGHFDIVKFLVEFGCDVNAQDSDGWTPLHCAASCNNLSMVKFLVENGACLFAATLSDHETPAEKCEEDEEGFDGCSEYLYSIQEKLGILHNGEVYAVFSYDAQNSDELTFNVNDRLVILRKGDDAENEWWWAKNANDEEGYVPRNLLGLYPRVPPQSSNFND